MHAAFERDRPTTVGRTWSAIRNEADWAGRVRARMPRPVGWLLADPSRVLTVAWIVAVLVVGIARLAHADPIIVGPDLAKGSPKTLFEQYDFLTYKLTVKPDEETQDSDWFGVSAAVLEVVGFINNMIFWACLGLLYGALTLLAWFLNLTLYRDSAPQIDSATQMIANTVFWPLIPATVACGAFIAYAKWRGEGKGFISDLGWVIAAGTLAVGFAAGPSSIMNEVDSVRQDMASGIISGSTQYVNTTSNPTGFPTPDIGGNTQEASTRKLIDSLWNTFGATPWCLAQFHELDICKVAGHHALANDGQWKTWMSTLDHNQTPPEFREWGHWIRGQDMTRTGYLLFLAMLSIPMGLILLRLIVAGLVAVVGFLLMLILGLLFLTFWAVPGWFRQMGIRYFVYTLGLQLQSLFITAVISGVMVISTVIATQVGRYGYFIVALLNLALFFAAVKARSWLEMLTTVGGGGSMGFATATLARSVVKTVASGVAGAVTGGVGLAAAGARAAGSAIANAGKVTSSGGLSPRTRGAGWKRVAGLDNGPVKATATRVRQPGNDPQIANRTTAALPAGTGAGTGTGGGGAGTAAPAASGAGTPPARRQLMAAQGSGTAGSTSAEPMVVDGKLANNVTQAGNKSSRIWVDKPGAGLSKLDKTPPPKPTKVSRGGVHTITPAKPPRGPKPTSK